MKRSHWHWQPSPDRMREDGSNTVAMFCADLKIALRELLTIAKTWPMLPETGF